MAEEYPRARRTRDACARVALSRAYVTYVSILPCVRTHVVNGAYTVNCKTTVRAPVVIKTNQRSMATVCDHCAACRTVILQACSKYIQTEKGSCARRVRIAVPLFAPLSQTDSTVFERRHRRLGQCLQRLLLNSSEDEARSLLAWLHVRATALTLVDSAFPRPTARAPTLIITIQNLDSRI